MTGHYEVNITNPDRLTTIATELYRRSQEYVEANDSALARREFEVTEFEDFADKHGISTVGKGVARVVVDFHSLPDEINIEGKGDMPRDFVVKLPLYGREEYRDGLHQNKREISLHESATSRQKMHMLPVLDHADDGEWVLMPYARQADGTEQYSINQFIDEANEVGIIGDDVRRENVGWFRDHLYLLDYGYDVELVDEAMDARA